MSTMDDKYKKSFGAKGEEIAVNFLQRAGYRVVARNFLIRGGEIDVVAKDQGEIIFVEVKTRINHDFGLPEESITYWKLKALQKTALFYLQKHNLGEVAYRFDLITVDYSNSMNNPAIQHFKNILN